MQLEKLSRLDDQARGNVRLNDDPVRYDGAGDVCCRGEDRQDSPEAAVTCVGQRKGARVVRFARVITSVRDVIM